MKKIISLFVLIAMLVTLCACAQKKDAAAEPAATLDPGSPEAMYGHIDQTQAEGGVHKIWNAEGVQFLLENPDKDYEILCNISKCIKKRI